MLSTFRKLFQKPSTVIGSALTLIFLIIALIGPFIAPYTATETSSDVRAAPSLNHWFGTDHLGRDVFSRVLIGTQSILFLAGVGTLLAVIIGTFLGLLSGYWGGWFDEILMRFFDSLLAIPAMLFALLLLGVIEAASVGTSRSFLSNLSVLLVIAIVYIPIVARVVRSEVLSLKEKDFVEAARLRGESLLFILFREILPSVLPALSVEAALRFSYAIFLVASLGFLGIGVQPPMPNWGLMVNEARIFVSLAPWSLYFPVAAIAALVISVNLMADGLKNILQSSVDIVPQRLFQSSKKTRASKSQSHETDTVVEFQNVTVSYTQGKETLDAVRNINLTISPGQIYGLVGESGSGKSTLALALMRYLSANGNVTKGDIFFSGRHMWSLDEKTLQSIWGSQMSLVPQNPMASLNPSIRVGGQITELLEKHLDLSQKKSAQLALDWLGKVNIPDPERVARSYPHQLSGGMQQRVLIAMALCTSPKFVVLDEPTTGLDVTTEAVMLDLLRDLIREQHTAALYISHDLGVVSQIADRVAVLYAGELVEDAATENLYQKPVHPYTVGLLNSVPTLGQSKREMMLHSMKGQIPSLRELPSGCVFTPRCPLAVNQCKQQRPALELINKSDSDRHIRCHRWDEIWTETIKEKEMIQTRSTQPSPAASETILQVKQLKTFFPLTRKLLDWLKRKPVKFVKAVDEVNLDLKQGQTLGLVGESGSGKTTLARAISGLTPATGGRIRLKQKPLPKELSKRTQAMLRQLQMVSQQPEEALNPLMTVGQSLQRSLKHLGKSSNQTLEKLLEQVGLDAGYIVRLPSQLSGGEKQRVAIARAFAADPEFIICDEPTSALDVSVQARILNLLSKLQQENQTSYLFISHDLASVSYLADEIAVIYLGELMESGPASAVFEPPYHPYTEALLSAVPTLDQSAKADHIRLEGDIPSPTKKPTGCPFHTRCPRFLGDICVNESPPWQTDESGHGIYCHIPKDELKRMQNSLIQPQQESDT